MGMLAAMSAAICRHADQHLPRQFEQREAETATMVFVLEVHDREHLAR